MAIEGNFFRMCTSRPPGKENCESRAAAMGLLDGNIKRARDMGGSAGMLDNGRWELHYPNRAMMLNWVEDENGDVQKFP